MKNRFPNNLRNELRSAGASDSEVSELAVLANDLKQLKKSKDWLSIPLPQDRQQNRWKKFIPIGLTSLTGLVLGMMLVILSQTVLPNSPLYAVQKLSDNVAIAVSPVYRGTVMMRRAQEVKQLTAEHANSSLVLATLADYQTEASAYKSVSDNYPVFEYCKSNLQQAAAIAPNPERQAIDKTLLSLQNV